MQVLQESINVLQGRAGAADNPHHFTQRQALLLIAHLVGDAHQPLHVGSAYVGADGTFVVPASQSDVTDGRAHTTHGDNDLLLGSRLLHAYWDTDAVKAAMRRAKVDSPGEYATCLVAKHQPPPMTAGAPVTWPAQWPD